MDACLEEFEQGENFVFVNNWCAKSQRRSGGVKKEVWLWWWGVSLEDKTEKRVISKSRRLRCTSVLRWPNFGYRIEELWGNPAEKLKEVFDEHFIDGKKRPEVSHHPLYVTVEQRVVAEDINNATKDEILRRIADKLQQVSDKDVRGPLSIKLQLLKAQPNKAKKDTLILLYNEIVEELGDLQAMQEACIPQDEEENDNQ